MDGAGRTKALLTAGALRIENIGRRGHQAQGMPDTRNSRRFVPKTRHVCVSGKRARTAGRRAWDTSSRDTYRMRDERAEATCWLL